MDIAGTYFDSTDRAELVSLYHLARTALAGGDAGRHARLIWAANTYASERGIPNVRAYKALCRSLTHTEV